MSASLTLSVATSARDFMDAYSVRESMYANKLGLDLNDFEKEKQWDQDGTVFLLREGEQCVATIRFLSLARQSCEMKELGILPREFQENDKIMEVTRLAAIPRKSPLMKHYGLLILASAAQWCVNNTFYEKYIAYCRMSVLKLMISVGASVIGNTFHIRDRTDETYNLIVGDIKNAARYHDVNSVIIT